MRVYLITFLFILNYPVQAFQKGKTLSYRDAVYEQTIKTVQMFPQGNSIQSSLAPPVKKMDEGSPLVLQFDELKNDADYYFVRFIHCNADWSPSDLRPNMYLTGFNEFEIENFEFSVESKINYVHYKFIVPEFKLPGNYLAVVYRDRNKKDLILTKRFMVYQNQVGVGGRILRSSSVSERLENQRIEVTMSYPELRSIDPRNDFRIVVRQNQRNDKERNLSPTFIDENAQTIRYQNLGSENDFPAGNEFRYFDLSTVNFNGRNVANAGFENNKPFAHLGIDEQRNDGYFQNLDLNGQYYIRDLEGGNSAEISAEYVETHFSLKIKKQPTDIYLLGAFNNWERTPESKMKWNQEKELYENSYLLKQGWYDYLYAESDSNSPDAIEQSFFETENLYEIFVYFRPMGSRGDLLVGYSRIDYNSRR